MYVDYVQEVFSYSDYNHNINVEINFNDNLNYTKKKHL